MQIRTAVLGLCLAFASPTIGAPGSATVMPTDRTVVTTITISADQGNLFFQGDNARYEEAS